MQETQVRSLVRELDFPYVAIKSSHVATKTWHSQINNFFLKKEDDFWWALKLEKQALRPHNMEQCPRCTPGLLTAIDADLPSLMLDNDHSQQDLCHHYP